MGRCGRRFQPLSTGAHVGKTTMLEKMTLSARSAVRKLEGRPMCVEDSSTHRLTSSVDIPALLNDPAPPKPRPKHDCAGPHCNGPNKAALRLARLASKNDVRRRDWLDRRMFHIDAVVTQTGVNITEGFWHTSVVNSCAASSVTRSRAATVAKAAVPVYELTSKTTRLPNAGDGRYRLAFRPTRGTTAW
jgi:hypothetical protein